MIKTGIRTLSIVILGLLFPAFVLVQAYFSLDTLGDRIAKTVDQQSAVKLFNTVSPVMKDGNDYALFSQIFAESANQQVVTNKQVIKVAVMQIGFAAMSLGLMFVVLGINDNGGEGGIQFAGVKVDFRTTSTGALVFTVGAAMAAAGGTLRNEYSTVGSPPFVYETSGAATEDGSIADYKRCKAEAPPDLFEECFAFLFASANAEQLK